MKNTCSTSPQRTRQIWINSAKLALEAAEEGLFPNHCHLCGLRSHRSIPLCAPCEADIPLNKHCCMRCALPLPAGVVAPRQCGACLHQPPPFDAVFTPFIYSEQVARLIHRWKYHGDMGLTALLAQLWLQEKRTAGAVDIMVPVPLHWHRLLLRGFNQAELLCHHLRRQNTDFANIALQRSLVARQRATTTQAALGAIGRGDNLRGAFTATQACDNLRVALVDDVFTTGSTAAAVSHVLRDAGASYIEVWCLARTPAPGQRAGGTL